MSRKFQTETTITFRQADPAQIMYFANVFSLAHDTFEKFIVEAGYKWDEWFSTAAHLIPIRHAEADYKAPFRPGRTYEVTAQVAHLGTTSFKMRYDFTQKGVHHASVWMVHAVLDPKTKEKMPLPDIMRQRLKPYLEAAHG